ncbi:hypothetical protein BDY24DRAFT_407153 [Mrakia frigida]|uniref:uncharacterized protein n=1 Tax=Mrakia frigida TaxID=29902 RepID=UPI003FCBF07E
MSTQRSKISHIDSTRPYSSPLTDTFNRHHTYLRISLTEKCNLRCTYCMPEDGVELQPAINMLSDAEVLKIATLFVNEGVNKIRVTGGEPTVRKGIMELMASLNTLRPKGLTQIGMTSNGIALHRKLPEMVENGLTHLNISLDTLVPAKFTFITRRQGHSAVMKSLETALALRPKGLTTKLNVVVMRNFNEEELVDFVEMTREKEVEVRFIEYMPFSGNKWSHGKLFSYHDMLETIRVKFPDFAKVEDDPNDTSKGWKVPGFKGKVGFITSMTEHFCGTCNRLRITADGNLKVCLFGASEVSLRDQIRANASDEELLETIRLAVGRKKAKHAGMAQLKDGLNRPMILIGHQQHQHASFHTSSSRPSSPASSFDPLPPPTLTHMNPSTGLPRMVSITPKASTVRTATAVGKIYLPEAAFSLLLPTPTPTPTSSSSLTTQPASNKTNKKGDPLIVAQLAGIMAAKRTADLIPLCHTLALSGVEVDFELEREKEGGKEGGWVKVRVVTECVGGTGVEMEALTSASVALLTVWDMVKAVAGKEMIIEGLMVVKKSGGKSGDWEREV